MTIHNMRQVTPTLAILFTLIALLPAPAGAGEYGTNRPFNMTGAGIHTIGLVEPGRCPGGTIFQTFIETTGQASHLGSMTVEADHCTYPDLSYGNGVMVITAADGDELYAPYQPSTQQPPASPDPGVILTNASHTFDGGTGRFEDATGWMECQVQLTVTDWATFTADLTATCTGMISY